MGSRQGLIGSSAFSAIVAAVLLSTLVTPPMLRFFFAHLDPGRTYPKNKEEPDI
jgi:hypothetical protein